MKVTAPLSFEQEMVVFDHLFMSKELYIVPGEQVRLLNWVDRNHTGCKIIGAHLDLENGVWLLDLEPVTVTT